MDNRSNNQFKPNYSVTDLENMFKLEQEYKQSCISLF